MNWQPTNELRLVKRYEPDDTGFTASLRRVLQQKWIRSADGLYEWDATEQWRDVPEVQE